MSRSGKSNWGGKRNVEETLVNLTKEICSEVRRGKDQKKEQTQLRGARVVTTGASSKSRSSTGGEVGKKIVWGDSGKKEKLQITQRGKTPRRGTNKD